VDRAECTKVIADAKRKSGLGYEEIASKIGMHPVWTAAALMGQASMAADQATAVVDLLDVEDGMRHEVATLLAEPSTKGAVGQVVPVDPLIYRFYEITQVYGPAIKAIIHEKFGDGIMSAIDFEIDIDRIPDPKGDRVKVTLNGKFLPYKTW
jgi:cyanate lyase